MFRIVAVAFACVLIAGCGPEEKKEAEPPPQADKVFDKSTMPPLKGDVGKKKAAAG